MIGPKQESLVVLEAQWTAQPEFWDEGFRAPDPKRWERMEQEVKVDLSEEQRDRMATPEK